MSIMPTFDDIFAEDIAKVRSYIKKILHFWRDKFEENCLTPIDFEEFWKFCVPNLYNPALNANCMNTKFNEDLAQTILFKTLDDFICNGDSTIVFKQLSEIDTAPSACCKPLTEGEAIFFCKECANNKTCFLCVECFKNSEHRNHKYKMCTSGGIGCCDCGNTEVWKKNSFCKLHIAGTSKEEHDKNLPEDFIKRTTVVFESVLWYIYRLLNCKHKSNINFAATYNMFNDHTDSFCAILYHDKHHTISQVIETLSNILKCDKRSSTEYITHIARKGRAIVKCSTYQHCSKLKSEIEKYTSRHSTKPMKVLVYHTHIIAHQIYAQKLLFWVEKYLKQGKGFRKIFADVILKSYDEEACICEGFLLRDSFLWKDVRSQWHKLLISGMFLEYENKKALAKIFAKNYGYLMKSFIQNDYAHCYSVSSLSIQLFTVPSIAHHLIAYEDILYILLETFISECTKKRNVAGKLEFGRGPVSQKYKRALYMLFDLRYLLSVIPENWTDELRTGFLRGISSMLKLFTMMQGMNAVTRQVGHHIEYEPEWKSGFKLQFKLSDSISLATEWCGGDKNVLIKAYRSVLEKLEKTQCYKTRKFQESVSIHLPLIRFLAALHLSLEKFSLHFDDPELKSTELTFLQIVEPVLRAKLMIAQVHTGMWKRNGNYVLKTLSSYHNVDYRCEMFDRDVTSLQIAASLVDSDTFLIDVLNKFSLFKWIMPGFEINIQRSSEDEDIKQIIGLVDEFLYLLIIIVGDRYRPGVSNVKMTDKIKKEVMQHLCIQSLPRSELIKTILDDLTSSETEVDAVIQELTIFKKATNLTGKSVFELNDQYYDEFNVYFYHYTREELSKAEEAQRTRRKAKGEIECCPPPKLPKLTESFSMLVNLLQCDVMLHIMQKVLERSIDLSARTFSEFHLHKVLYLIGYALLEEETKYYPSFKFIEKAGKFKLYHLLEKLLKSSRKHSHEELLKWTLMKYNQVANKKEEDLKLEKKSSSIKADYEKKRRAELAIERRAKLMKQMQTMQNNFIKENPGMFEETLGKSRTSDSAEIVDITETLHEKPIALGPNQTIRMNKNPTYICIICQEEEKLTAEGPSMVFAAFIQQSTTLSQQEKNNPIMDFLKYDLLYLHANLGPAPHISTCGHIMHSECWKKYFNTVVMREYPRLRHLDFEKQEFLCPLCERLSNTVLPLIPSLTSLHLDVPKNDITFNHWMENIYTVLSKTVKICHCTACIYSNRTSTEQQANRVKYEVSCIQQPHQILYSYELSPDLPESFLKLFTRESIVLNNSHKEMVCTFAQTACTRNLYIGSLSLSERLASVNWKSLAYTIHSIEVLLRDSNKPLFGQLPSRQRECIQHFTRIVCVLGSTLPSNVFIKSHAINLLSILFNNNNDTPSVFEFDSFGFLLSLTFSLPSLSGKSTPVPIPTGGTLDLYLLRIMFICHIVKILVSLKNNPDSSMDTGEKNDSELLEILEILGKKTENISTHLLWKRVQTACLPFLRCCVLFYHYLTEVPVPPTLTEVGGDTFENMCSYLDLPQTPKNLFNSTGVKKLVCRWYNHDEILDDLNNANLPMTYEPPHVPHLIDLPSDYSELIITSSTFACPKSDLADPYLCLKCGEIFCSCITDSHKIKCGADVGIFLQIRYCEILLNTAPGKSCLLPAPYLDDYGETDKGLSRGNRLKLCSERYRKIQTLWLSHGIHEEIARSFQRNI